MEPNLDYYIYQLKLSEAYKCQSIKLNKKGDKTACVQNNIDISSFVVDNNLSGTQFEDLMKLINNVVSRECKAQSSVSTTIFPKSIKVLKKQTMKNIIGGDDKDTLFQLKKFEYRLDLEVFPNHDKKVTAFSYNILQIIADELLNMDPINFITKPDIKFAFVEKTKERLFSDYTTGLHFEELHKFVTINGLFDKRVVLCIGLTLDETTTYSGKRSFTPVYLFILNVINGDFKMHLIGYAPGDKLPYSKKEISHAITTNFQSNQKKITIIKYCIRHSLRQFQRKFLYDISKVILTTQVQGIQLQIGPFNNPSSFVIHAFIHLVMITGDHAQLEYLSGTPSKLFKY